MSRQNIDPEDPGKLRYGYALIHSYILNISIIIDFVYVYENCSSMIDYRLCSGELDIIIKRARYGIMTL